MQAQGPTSQIIRFGTFELDRVQGTLSKSGLRVRLQGQPLQILTLLLDQAGQVVTRDEIRQKLWSDQTFVEFDDALNTAMGKLRAALGDAAENPRFIETVPRRGYRFIAPVIHSRPAGAKLEPMVAVPPEVQPASGSDESIAEPASAVSASVPRHGRRNWIVGTATIMVVLAAGVALYQRYHAGGFKPSSGDLVILADFVNTTGEPVFDDALRQALEIGLGQSPSIQIMPERKASVILTQMGHAAEDRMTGKTAIEVCQRAGGKVTIQGSITSLGSVYLIGLAAIRCDNGEPIANEQAQARHKEDVVDALGRVTVQLRTRLGESLPSIQKYNAPLEQATTASLDALNAYSLALLTWDKKGDHDSLPIFKKAVELDPNFAQAHGALATIYYNLGQGDLAREHATKAFELRAHVTQAEKSSIEARYYEYVTGELEKDADVRSLVVQNHPESAGAFNHLGNADQALGHYDQAVDDYRRAQALDPTRGGTHSEMANVLLALNRLEEASTVLADAQKRSLQTEGLLQTNYHVAFLRGDDRAMAQLVQQASSQPETAALLLSEQSNTDAFYGRVKQANESTRKAAILMEQQGDKDSAARYWAQAAIREAEFGDKGVAQEFISNALKLSRNQNVTILAAFFSARVGQVQQAETLSKQLNDQFPQGTYIQKYWLPLIRAEMDMRAGRFSKAVDDLSLLNPPLELSAPAALGMATLYPVYVRGQAYLAAGDGPRAAIEFQKLRDHRTLLANYPLESLALAGLGRAYARAGDSQKARQNYEAFFDLWKDADPAIPFLKELKREHSKLH
jgi:DNA-binding winged helix-turn-helix (wHTH) protein/tetratricopeptide (TPR) repeat protein